MITLECNTCRKLYQIPVTMEQVYKWKNSGITAQKAFPFLTADQRELLISQICGECFDELCPPDDD